MKVKIKNFKGELPNYLTLYKEYEVNSIEYGGCNIHFDNNQEHFVLFKNCSHLNGGSWEIVDE